MEIFHDTIGDDYIAEPWIPVSAVYAQPGGLRSESWGVSAVWHGTDDVGCAMAWDPPIKDWDKEKPLPWQSDEDGHPAELPPAEAAMALWVGERADGDDRIVILDEGTRSLPLLAFVETGRSCPIEADDRVHVRFREVFSGEALFGICVAARMAGRTRSAQAAAEAARKACRYVTDDCWVRGVRFDHNPTRAELWVGPYVYWLFTEYLDVVGPEPRLAEWLAMLDRFWAVDHQWRDFLDRPATADGYVYRADSNGMLAVAALGYLGIKHMAEIDRPLHWRVRSVEAQIPSRTPTDPCDS